MRTTTSTSYTHRVGLKDELEELDKVGANLTNLESVWQGLTALLSASAPLAETGPSGAEYRQLVRRFAELLDALPAIDGVRPSTRPLAIAEVTRARRQAERLPDEREVAERRIHAPGVELEEYRAGFTQVHRALRRRRLDEIVADVDAALAVLQVEVTTRARGVSLKGPLWDRLKAAVSIVELSRLLPAESQLLKGFGLLDRHLGWGEANDLAAIVEHDWPTVRAEIRRVAFDKSEPLPLAMKEIRTVKVPRVFISYSWDAGDHRAWVKELAARLRGDGVETVLDQWALVPGDQLAKFMETSVRESDFVLVVCTPNYRERSDNRVGGVGYEGDIMTGELVGKIADQRKFVPIARHADRKAAMPSWLMGKLSINLSGDPYSETEYADLLRTLHGKREQAPPVGPPPFASATVAAAAPSPTAASSAWRFDLLELRAVARAGGKANVKRIEIDGAGYLAYAGHDRIHFPDHTASGRIESTSGGKMPIVIAKLLPKMQYDREHDRHVSANPMFLRTEDDLTVLGAGRLHIQVVGELAQPREDWRSPPSHDFDDFNMNASFTVDLSFNPVGGAASLAIKARLVPSQPGKDQLAAWEWDRKSPH